MERRWDIQGGSGTAGAALYSSRGGWRVCSAALPPNKTGGTYERMWRQIRALDGEVGAAAHRLVTVDFERASINAIQEMFPASRIGGCYFHLGQSLYRRVQRLGLQGKYETNEEFRLRVKMLSSLAFLPQEDISRVRGAVAAV